MDTCCPTRHGTITVPVVPLGSVYLQDEFFFLLDAPADGNITIWRPNTTSRPLQSCRNRFQGPRFKPRTCRHYTKGHKLLIKLTIPVDHPWAMLVYPCSYRLPLGPMPSQSVIIGSCVAIQPYNRLISSIAEGAYPGVRRRPCSSKNEIKAYTRWGRCIDVW